jgi:hypothetical protein
MSTIFVAGAVVACAATASAIGFLAVSRFVPDRWIVADADAASALYATIGMVYAILIAIAAIAVWEPRTDAGSNADLEATSLVEAYWSASTLNEADRMGIRAALTDYLREASSAEWKSLHDSRKGTAAAEHLFTDLRMRVDQSNPATDKEQAAYAQLTAQLATAASARRARIAAADEGMPGLLWPVLIGGGLVSIVFLYLFGLERTFPNGLMMATVGGMLALLLFVIYQVEFPYSRDFAIGPDSLVSALASVSSSG